MRINQKDRKYSLIRKDKVFKGLQLTLNYNMVRYKPQTSEYLTSLTKRLLRKKTLTDISQKLQLLIF